MAEDSTPVLRESLDKCFIEQQLALNQLTVQYEDLEDKVELVDCFYTQLDGNQEENRRNVEKLEKRVTELEVRMCKVEADVESAVDQDALDERDGKIDLIEERVAVMKVQNIELRNHLNLTIDMLNNVTRILNNLFTNKEQSDEATQMHEVTTSQTAAMEAAEEHEARKKLTINGLTSDEWKNLLRLK